MKRTLKPKQNQIELEKVDIKNSSYDTFIDNSWQEKNGIKSQDLKVKAMPMRGTEIHGERIMSTDC